MKQLILFDIDGTLLSTNGAARRAFHRAMLEVYGTAGPIDTHVFNGKTDPQIARELLASEGFANGDVDTAMPRLFERYLHGMRQEIAHPAHETSVYPGVRELLNVLETSDAALVGLLTGNIAEGAALKLTSAQLDHYFSLGAYGSDSEHRNELPAIAVQRAFERTGRNFSGKDIVIIGDTPSDVLCGQGLGVFAVGVCTGGFTRDDLLAAGADIVFDDLSETERVLDSLRIAL
jgi:phosphoglycolate phosphatase-like HAD superfamily hydrolase